MYYWTHFNTYYPLEGSTRNVCSFIHSYKTQPCEPLKLNFIEKSLPNFLCVLFSFFIYLLSFKYRPYTDRHSTVPIALAEDGHLQHSDRLITTCNPPGVNPL